MRKRGICFARGIAICLLLLVNATWIHSLGRSEYGGGTNQQHFGETIKQCRDNSSEAIHECSRLV
jgi:hypothetical protein